MDLQTENRIAKALLEEARKMRIEAEKEGVQAYLRQPGARARPNSRFLTATVLGVQQANRAVEVDEMWRAREKERELETKHRSRSKERSKHHSESLKGSSSYRSEHEKGNQVTSCSSRNSVRSDFYSDEDRRGLQDDEIEEFLQTRVKRGRGEIGSRMDEPGPYLSSMHHVDFSNVRVDDEKNQRVLGPEKPGFFKSSSSEKSTKERSSSKDTKRKEKKKSTNTRRIGKTRDQNIVTKAEEVNEFD